jgi:glycosyltransferase involved in cell wall biosynthesis
MLRIAVVTRYFPSSGEPWAGRSLYEPLRILARRAEVRIFYPNADYPRFLRPRSRMYDQLDRSFSPPGVNVSYFNYPALPLLSRPLNGWMAARTLLSHVRNYAPDIIFGCFLYPECFAALKIGRALALPVVVNSIGSDINQIADPISARHTRSVVRGADAVLTVSDDLRKKAVAMGASPERTRTIINGCNLSVFHVMDRLVARQKLGIDPNTKAVVYVGRMDLRKGLRELVEAAVALQTHRNGLRVYLVGDGPDRTNVQSLIDAKNAAEYVHALPGCPSDEVAVWMAAADVITLPSYMEGCPNVILEARACGRPVVATNVGGIPEIMSDEFGQLVSPRNPGALAEALASVLDKTWDPAAISTKWGRGWDAVEKELLEVFESLCQPAR